MSEDPIEPPPAAQAQVPRRVVVVDDDPGVRRALARLLRVEGFEVTTFSAAEALLAGDLAERPLCMIVDIHLGGMSGLDLAGELARRGIDVPVVFITAHDDPPTRGRALRFGAFAYLPKPFDDGPLLAAIRKAARSAPPACATDNGDGSGIRRAGEEGPP